MLGIEQEDVARMPPGLPSHLSFNVGDKVKVNCFMVKSSLPKKTVVTPKKIEK